jgi:hypothetical protein
MSQKSGPAKWSSERIVKDIRRATRKQYSAEEKSASFCFSFCLDNPSLPRPLPFPFSVPVNRGCVALRPRHDNGITLTRGAPKPLSQVAEPAAPVFAFEQNAPSA